MNIDIAVCKRWSYQLSNQVLNVLREANWLTKGSNNSWPSISTILNDFVLTDDGVDPHDKMVVAEEVVNRWCSFIRASCDPNLPANKRTNIFDKCKEFASDVVSFLEKDLPPALKIYQEYTVDIPNEVGVKVKNKI